MLRSLSASLTVLALAATPALARVPALDCTGNAPDWVLTFDGAMATFSFQNRESVLDVIQSSTAEGRDWPVAMTLIGPRDSGVLIVEPLAEDDTFSALILTQHAETPVLLAGTCAAG